VKIKFKDYTILEKNEHIELLDIRNLDYVRAGTNDGKVIELESHLSWVDNLKLDSSKIFYGVYVDGQLLGGINLFDITDSSAHWGLFFKQGIHPFVTSFATYLLMERAFSYYGIEEMFLEVNKKNSNAYKFDLNFGFSVYDEYKNEDEEFYKMNLSKDNWSSKKESGLLGIIYKKLQAIEYKFIERR
jgi:hypothetical protein